MTRTSGWVLPALLLLLPSALKAQRPDPGPLADARRGIERGNAQYIAAFARADADGVAEVYDIEVALQTVQVWLVDDLAYETGTWSCTYTPGAKPELTVGGRYVTTWRRQADGGWKIQSDLAVPGT